MKKMIRRKLYTLAACAGILAFATACGSQNPNGGVTSPENSNEVNNTITVVDQNGMEVTIPENPERLVTTALPLPSIYALTGEPIENLVGVHPDSTSAIENSIMAAMYPELVGIADNLLMVQTLMWKSY